MARIAIIGGHGKVALRLARLLTADGHEVISLFRNPDHQEDVAATGATPVVLDVENSSTDEIARQLKGRDAVVWSAGAGGGNPPRTYAVDRDAAIRSMDAARQAGVRRYVMVSYHGARRDHGVPPEHPFFPYAEAKAAADDYLRNTDLDWTILGPGRLTDEPGSGRIRLDPELKASNRDTSRDNVAQVAVAVLEDRNSVRKTLWFVDGDVPIRDAIATAS